MTFALSRRIFVAGLSALATGVSAKGKPADALRSIGFVFSASYTSNGRLTLANTANDGNVMAATFQKLKFSNVIRSLNDDADAFGRQFSSFLNALRPSQVAFIYLCGHGVQIKGKNYILLNDCKTFVEVGSLIEATRRVTPTVVMLLDACRNDPAATLVKAETRGLRALTLGDRPAGIPVAMDMFRYDAIAGGDGTRITPFEIQGTGVKVVFSTDPQNAALDGATIASTNSPFVESLSKHLLDKKSLDDIMAAVTGDVLLATDGEQAPWSQGSLGEPLFLAGPPVNINPAKPPFQVVG